jgi:hypothetical protein
MASITVEEVDTLYRECTNYKSKTFTYVRPLGLRQLSLSKSESGPQKYSGIVQEFYDATRDVIIEHAAHYRSRKEVYQAVQHKSLRPEIADQCLDQYGPNIWNNGKEEPYTTVSDEFYPRHLVFENADDRERFVSILPLLDKS